jgi:hypothetical protein
MTRTVHLLGYSYSDEALRELVEYGVDEVQSGRADRIRFGVLESQEPALRACIDRIAPAVKYEVTHGNVTPSRGGAPTRPVCECCGRPF